MKHIKTGIDKKGHKYSRMVNDEQILSPERKSGKNQQKTASKDKKSQWYDEFKKYNLNKYPVGIPKDQVTINLDGDINSHSVMKWKDPKTGKQQDAYTREFLHRNAEVKWARIKNVSSKIIQSIKTKADRALDGKEDKAKQTASIIKIIAHTGLRIGSRGQFQKTKNRGVSTLNPGNIKVVGDNIFFSFVGKSYKDNVSHIKDAKLANFLKERQKVAEKKKSDFLFDYDRRDVDNTFKNDFGFKGLKLKDMRTYIATSVAKDILYEDRGFAKKLTNDAKTNKKLIKAKLIDCYDKVSKKLNNTPKMARDSYIHPAVVEDWLIKLGANVEEFKKSMDIDTMELKVPSLDDIIKSDRYKYNADANINEDDEENCDTFPMQEWEEDEE